MPPLYHYFFFNCCLFALFTLLQHLLLDLILSYLRFALFFTIPLPFIHITSIEFVIHFLYIPTKQMLNVFSASTLLLHSSLHALATLLLSSCFALSFSFILSYGIFLQIDIISLIAFIWHHCIISGYFIFSKPHFCVFAEYSFTFLWTLGDPLKSFMEV